MTNDVLAVLGVGKDAKASFKRKAAEKGYTMSEAVKVWISQFANGKIALPIKKKV